MEINIEMCEGRNWPLTPTSSSSSLNKALDKIFSQVQTNVKLFLQFSLSVLIVKTNSEPRSQKRTILDPDCVSLVICAFSLFSGPRIVKTANNLGRLIPLKCVMRPLVSYGKVKVMIERTGKPEIKKYLLRVP